MKQLWASGVVEQSCTCMYLGNKSSLAFWIMQVWSADIPSWVRPFLGDCCAPHPQRLCCWLAHVYSSCSSHDNVTTVYSHLRLEEVSVHYTLRYVSQSESKYQYKGTCGHNVCTFWDMASHELYLTWKCLVLGVIASPAMISFSTYSVIYFWVQI